MATASGSGGGAGGAGGSVNAVVMNQDASCFAAATEQGFVVYNIDPLKERFRRDFGRGVGRAVMLFRCNLLAIVGGGNDPAFPPSKVVIFDDHQQKSVAELEFRSAVKNVLLRRDRVIVVLINKTYVYAFSNLKLMHQLETVSNPLGLCEVSASAENAVLACCGLKPGFVHVELYDRHETQIIQAHTTALSALALNVDGSRLATASEKGTLIRVFATASGQQLCELRRGADRAVIHSIAFSADSRFLGVSSDKPTVHIFTLGDAAVSSAAASSSSSSASASSSSSSSSDMPPSSPSPSGSESPAADRPVARNTPSKLAFMKGVLPAYFNSEWSFAHFTLPDKMRTRTVVAFGGNKIYVVGLDGTYLQYSFDVLKGGEARQEIVTNWLAEPTPI